MEKIKHAFPSLQKEFYDVLCDRLKEHEFSDERLLKAVNHVIDTCIYPIPVIANFIIFDKEEMQKQKNKENMNIIKNIYNGKR